MFTQQLGFHKPRFHTGVLSDKQFIFSWFIVVNHPPETFDSYGEVTIACTGLQNGFSWPLRIEGSLAFFTS